MARLTGKVALITGASGGQGAAEAELFVREEAAVVLTDIDTAAGEALARRPGRQHAVPAPGRRRRGVVEGNGFGVKTPRRRPSGSNGGRGSRPADLSAVLPIRVR
jgi:NAD(P)-dependent dehydrogenase (short-subunit alcohol dehydrogenase family)